MDKNDFSIVKIEKGILTKIFQKNFPRVLDSGKFF